MTVSGKVLRRRGGPFRVADPAVEGLPPHRAHPSGSTDTNASEAISSIDGADSGQIQVRDSTIWPDFPALKEQQHVAYW